MKRNYAISVLLALLALGILFFAYRTSQKTAPVRQLPIYGEKDIVHGDTVYHKVGSFSFMDQYARAFTEKQVQGKIYVTDYFFTTCQSICPVMSKQMERVQSVFADEPRLLIVSHTVNPEFDSVPVLSDYAKAHGAIKDKWFFVTGDKKALYDLARKGYYLNTEVGDGGPNDFIHTQNFALVDGDGQIRGYYDGTDSAEVKRLILDAGILIKTQKSVNQ